MRLSQLTLTHLLKGGSELAENFSLVAPYGSVH